MKFILIKRYDDNAIEVDDIVADGFDAAVKTAATDCAENEVDSGLADVSLVHVAAIMDMAPHIERELAARRLLESAERAAAQEAAERAEYERLREKFEPKKYPFGSTGPAGEWAPGMANLPTWHTKP